MPRPLHLPTTKSTMTMPCQDCRKAIVDFPAEYCSRCQLARTQQAEIDAPRTLRANRLELLRIQLNGVFLSSATHNEVLLDLIDIVEELNEHS